MLIVGLGATSFQCGLRPAFVTRHGHALMSDPEVEALARLDTLNARNIFLLCKIRSIFGV